MRHTPHSSEYSSLNVRAVGRIASDYRDAIGRPRHVNTDARYPDPQMPLGVLGAGEVGITGAGAAIANAVYHATGRRVRNLPITLDQLL